VSLNARLSRLEQAIGPSLEAGPSVAVIKMWAPSLRYTKDIRTGQEIHAEDPPEHKAYRERIIASLPPSVHTMVWCGLNGRDEGAGIRLWGNGWNELRPLPEGQPT
jgi:hypothetical protein